MRISDWSSDVCSSDLTYGRGPVPPIASHRIRGSRLDDGTIMQERRVIGLCDDEPEGKDLAVKIEVDGEVRCFCKAKYEEAEEAGVTRDWKGGTSYLDVVEPTVKYLADHNGLKDSSGC